MYLFKNQRAILSIRVIIQNMTNQFNPTPVAVALIGVQDEFGVGLLSIQRQSNMGTGAGGWALPGGYIEHENAENAAQRETKEETFVVLDADLFTPFATRLGGKNNDILLIFCQYARLILPESLSVFTPNEEVSAIQIWRGEDSLVFPHHDEVARLWLQKQQPTPFLPRRLK